MTIAGDFGPPEHHVTRSLHVAPVRERPIVFVLAAYYVPGYKAGGPIRTIRNLVGSLGNEFDFRIFTSDHDFSHTSPYPDVRINEWNHVDGARVFYADATARRPSRLAATLREVGPDLVYVNSFFSPLFSIAPLMLRWLGTAGGTTPWIVAPRGEFATGAMAIKRPKKRAFMTVAHMLRLHRGVLWQASSPLEAEDIRREYRVSEQSIHIAPNLTAPVAPSIPAQPQGRDGRRLSVCFLARVCAMKNLAFVLETLVQCRCDVDLHIYGPLEDQAYADSCRSLVPHHSPSLAVTWHGEVPHEQVRAVIAAHDLFFLPTLGENFGHGIFEALAAGVPVLVSDRTPWRDLDEARVGWVRPLDDRQSFVDVIEGLAATPREEQHAMRRRAHSYAARFADSSAPLDANRRLFRHALDGRP